MRSKQLLLELKTILEEDHNLKLNFQEVAEIGTTLLAFIETLLKVEAKYSQQIKEGNHE